jgi:hypothetical protein
LLAECPKPIVSAPSMAWLSAYALWKRSEESLGWEWRAKTVEAFLHLDRLMVELREDAARQQPAVEYGEGTPMQERQ